MRTGTNSAVKSKRVLWNGLDDPNSDLCARVRGALYDVTRSDVDGAWSVIVPIFGRLSLRFTTRDDARAEAESFMRKMGVL